MKDFFRKRPLLGFFVICVAGMVVSTWIINPKSGPLAKPVLTRRIINVPLA